MSYALNIPFEYNQMEYYEFVWLFERLVEERKRESDDIQTQKGRMSISNLGANIAQMNSTDNKPANRG